MIKVALFRPASSPGDVSRISAWNRLRSAHFRYMRMSISTQSCASTPPCPTDSVITALWFAYGSVNSRSSSRARSSEAISARSLSTCFCSSGSLDASSSSSIKSRARRSSLSHDPTSWRFSADSRAIALARAGSSHAPGWVRRRSSSSARLSLAGRSKMLLELKDPVEDVFRTQLRFQWLSPVALLEFLARAAPARVVAADLNVRAGGGTRRRRRADRGAHALLRRAVGAAARAVGVARPALEHLAHQRGRGWWRRVALHLHPEDARDDRALDTVAELVEHLERFVLVFDKRVALAVGAKPNALAELLHLGQILHPLPVDRAQHHVALDVRHQVRADLLDLAVVSLRRGRVQVLRQALSPAAQRILGDLRPSGDRQVRGQVLHEALQVPVLDVPVAAVGLDPLLDDVVDVAHDVVARVGALEDLAPLLVDDLALLVHHVVVLDHVLAGVEVHALDLLLRAGDRTRDPRVLDRLDLEAVHQPADPVRRRPDDLHQVVFERDEEAAGARVALTARAAAELVVDASRLVALGADDVQAADVGDAGTKHDVGSAAGHVGRDGHTTRLPRLGNDGRLPLVLLGVKHVVLDAALFEHARQPLGLLDRDGTDEHRPLLLVHLDDLVDHGLELRLLGLVDDVRVVLADHVAVCWDDHDVE